MTLDEIRKLVAERQAAMPWIAGAGARARWERLCDVTDALLAVIDALPKCLTNCGEVATVERGIGEHRCDQHKRTFDKDLPYAKALRALARKQ